MVLASAAWGAQTYRPGERGWAANFEEQELWPQGFFSLRAGEAIHPWLGAGSLPFGLVATLDVPEKGDYRFLVEMAGGRVESPIWGGGWVTLDRGPNSLEVHPLREGPGDTRFRILWEHRPTATGGFPPEPIPFSVLLEPRNHWRFPSLEWDYASRVLLERKGCINCHAASAAEVRAVAKRPGPDLSRAGARLSASWMRRWIADPGAVRAGADMPGLFRAGEERDVEAVVHFLASLRDEGTHASVEAPASEDDVRAGRRLYHTIGCVACHGALASTNEILGEEYISDEVPAVEVRAPFGDLAHKWAPGELARFLREPRSVHRDGRMPSFDLTEDEARRIAAYLVSVWGVWEGPLEVDAELAGEGRKVFVERKCSACHELADLPPGRKAKPLAALSLAGPCSFTASPVDHLKDAVAMVRRSTGAPAPLDEARRAIERLNCLACHTMNGAGGLAEELRPYFIPADERTDLGDEGRLPPDLTGVGWKLTTSWLRQVLVGHGRARPYLSVRMPSYGEEHVGALADALARLEGIEPDTDVEEPVATDELVLAGRELMGREALGCMACHVFADRPPTGSPGPAITQFGERLRFEFARAFLMNPQRFKPGGRMPDFGTGAKSSVAGILDGDMLRQIEAMWAYFSLGEAMPAPEGVEAGASYRLGVGERPIVMRAFLPSAGTRGIAVGLPVGIHYSFDAASARLVEAWRGDFLDLAGSWAGRGGNELGGRGSVLWAAPEGPPFRVRIGAEPVPDFEHDASAGEAAGFDFRGYRLDGAGEPTFLYEARGLPVEERLALRLSPAVSLTRSFRVELPGEATSFWFHAPRPSVCRWRIAGGAWQPAPDVGGPAGDAWFEADARRGAEVLECEIEITP